MSDQEAIAAEFWRMWFNTGEYAKEKRQRHFLSLLPQNPRCKLCCAPFSGIGVPVVRLVYNKRPSNLNPRFCNFCEEFARKFPGGAEVSMSMLFADVRGSTALSENMSPSEFSRLINRFYVVATNVLVKSEALIDKLAGDSVAAFWGAGFAGPDYVRRTVEAGKELLRATGHADPGGPWVPVGVGVHAGIAFFGSMGTASGMTDITAVGDEVNLAARLASQAGTGEVLVSEAALDAAGLEAARFEPRQLKLKGLSEPVSARVLPIGAHSQE